MPRSADAPEGDGFILTVVDRFAEKRTDLLILDGNDVSRPPIATIKLPFALPMSFPRLLGSRRGDCTMTDTAKARQARSAARRTGRAARHIERDLDEPHDPDCSERAVQMEDDESLEAQGRAGHPRNHLDQARARPDGATADTATAPSAARRFPKAGLKHGPKRRCASIARRRGDASSHLAS